MWIWRHAWDTPPFLLIVSPTLPVQSVDAYVRTYIRTYVRSVSHVTTKRKEVDHIPWVWGSVPRALRARGSPAKNSDKRGLHSWLHLRTQSNVRSSFLSLRPQFVSHTFINLTGEKIRICKKIWKVDPNVQKPFIPIWPHSNGAMKDWILAPVFWRFWREFLNAAAKLSSFFQSQQR